MIILKIKWNHEIPHSTLLNDKILICWYKFLNYMLISKDNQMKTQNNYEVI